MQDLYKKINSWDFVIFKNFFTIVDRDQFLTIVDHFTRSFSNDRRSSIILLDKFQTIVDRDQDHDRDRDRRSTIDDRDRAHHWLYIYIYTKQSDKINGYKCVVNLCNDTYELIMRL